MGTRSERLGNTRPRDSVVRGRRRSTVRRAVLLVLTAVAIGLAWPYLQDRLFPDPVASGAPGAEAESPPAATVATATAADVQAPTPTASPAPLITALAPGISDPQIDPAVRGQEGLWILALAEAGRYHLFAYHPQHTPFTRLTSGPWDDRDPAVNPDGSQIAFASNRRGYWDLYILTLETGEIRQVTDSPAYEGAPSWSPDGLWLAYETYENGQLDIYVRPIPDDQPAIPLTGHPAADYAPAWSPEGRQIAFVSNRSGDAEIWLANLDQAGEGGHRNISLSPRSDESHPAWAPDGRRLAWASDGDGIRTIYRWDADLDPRTSVPLGGGDWPAWSPDGQTLLTRLITPGQTYLSAISASAPGIVSLPAVNLAGPVAGLTWVPGGLPGPLPLAYSLAAAETPAPPWLPALTPNADVPGGRQGLVALDDVEAPYPQLHDLVDESFHALRARVANELGWDLLSSLENAFVPLTAPLAPSMGADWLYTGRALALNTGPMNAGWMTVVREDFGAQTYWRLYVRARFQDGSQGRPLDSLPWDFSARDGGDVRAYENGGARAHIVPEGYWVDFTHLADAYGWSRVPALGSWRTFYQGTRLNEFVQAEGLEWAAAMLELYPPEALITPTPIVPPTRTPSPTPRWYRTPTPTHTSTPRPTFTPSPTWTPSPSPTSIGPGSLP